MSRRTRGIRLRTKIPAAWPPKSGGKGARPRRSPSSCRTYSDSSRPCPSRCSLPRISCRSQPGPASRLAPARTRRGPAQPRQSFLFASLPPIPTQSLGARRARCRDAGLPPPTLPSARARRAPAGSQLRFGVAGAGRLRPTGCWMTRPTPRQVECGAQTVHAPIAWAALAASRGVSAPRIDGKPWGPAGMDLAMPFYPCQRPAPAASGTRVCQ